MWIEIFAVLASCRSRTSRPARALWIEILIQEAGPGSGRMSRPARALWIEILYARGVRAGSITSRPARALWIEILHTSMCAHQIVGRGPRGPCGLKFHYYFQIHFLHSRGPRGPCGLKCPYVPLRPQAYAGRGPRGPCGLKYRYRRRNWHTPESRPARALWIEILLVSSFFISPIVEAREGLVD